ncbi:MAG: hypothetical protein E7E64_05070 [Clostridium celatum]|uniref:hypothetical protein n=1 Tax=Clostridium tertium TaxID=1559 RepID=UPI002902F596|nr:hypothetical protein [Clostridium celatum]
MENEDKQSKNIIINKILFILCVLSISITLIFLVWFIVEHNRAFNIEVDILRVQPVKNIVDKKLYESTKILGYVKNSLLVSVLLLVLKMSFFAKTKKSST